VVGQFFHLLMKDLKDYPDKSNDEAEDDIRLAAEPT